MRNMKRFLAMTTLTLAAGATMGLGVSGTAQAADKAESVAAVQQNNDWGKGSGNWNDDHHKGWGKGGGDWDDDDHKGWNKKHRYVRWEYAGSFRSYRACERAGWLGERYRGWDDTKCVGGGWGGVKLYVKKYHWGGWGK